MSSLLTCPSCLEISIDPQKLKPCGHRICIKCVNKTKELLGGDKSSFNCPYCHVLVVKYSLDPIIKQFVDEELAKTKNRCDYHPTKPYFSICTKCQEPVCSECILSNHNGHTFISGDDSKYSNQLKIQMVEASKAAGSQKLKIDNELKVMQLKSEATESTLSIINNYILNTIAALHKLLQKQEFTNKKVSEADLDKQVIHYLKFNDSFNSKSKILETILNFKSDSPFNVYVAIKLLKELNSTDELLSTYNSEKINYRNKTVIDQDVQKSIEDLIPNLYIRFECTCGVGDSTTPCPCLPTPTKSSQTKIITTITPTPTKTIEDEVTTTTATTITPAPTPTKTTDDEITDDGNKKEKNSNNNNSIVPEIIENLKIIENNNNLPNQPAVLEVRRQTAVVDPLTSNINTIVMNDPKKVAGTLNAVQKIKQQQDQQKQQQYELELQQQQHQQKLELELKEQKSQYQHLQLQHQQKQQVIKAQPGEKANPADDIKKINFIYFLCGMEDKLHLSRCVRYHPAKDEWSFMPPTRYKRACVTDAGVVAFGYLFIFGGNDSLETYEKFNIQANRWEIGGNIPTGGGSSMSATFDKQRECIYLVGGVKFNQTSSKIEKCTYGPSGNGRDYTLKFEILANLKYSRYYCYTIVHGNLLYIIGGTNKTKEESYFSIINNIEVYNIETKQVSMFFEGLDESENRIEGVCFDGEKFYIITIDSFFSFTVATKQRTKLFYPPIENMRFGFSISIGKSNMESEKGQNIIYLIGDRGSSHFRYNITTGLWTTSPSKRPISSYFHAAAVEYEV